MGPSNMINQGIYSYWVASGLQQSGVEASPVTVEMLVLLAIIHRRLMPTHLGQYTAQHNQNCCWVNGYTDFQVGCPQFLAQTGAYASFDGNFEWETMCMRWFESEIVDN